MSTEYLIGDVAFCLYDLSCNENIKPINLYLDVLLNKTLSNKMAFKIEAVLADMKISDLTDLSSIVTTCVCVFISFHRRGFS